MQHFYNAADTLIDDVLAGVSALTDVRIAEPSQHLRILVRADWDREHHGRDQVALLSGGGGGHEPAHAGFIGEGMLTGAVVGGLFASPSVDAVLAAIREVCGAAGCLLIVKNYTGDRLNFGLAAEQARQEGLAVSMVIVGDDIALPDSPQPRGIAGTLIVHKLAGWLAAQQMPLETLSERVDAALPRIASLGLALSHAARPGEAKAPCAPELGLGIHNEGGVRRVEPESASEAVETLLAPLTETLSARGYAPPYVALLNNLGGAAEQEMQVLAASLLVNRRGLALSGVIGPAAMMTSLDMQGFSITLVAADDDLVSALAAPTTAPAWPGLNTPCAPARFTPQVSETTVPEHVERDAAVETRLHAAIEILRDSRQALDDLDARSGDGDAGTSLASGAEAVARRLDAGQLESARPGALFGAIGACLARDMGGSSGVLLSILFTAAGAELAENDDLAAALAVGIERMQRYGGAAQGDRTLLDALIPAVETLREGGDLALAAERAREGADATATMARAGAGRSAYLPESALQGVTDPGAEAVARVLGALAEA
ncbi:DAK2 domain-containing protein [Salinicola endophyticus]|uniref:DAK2 domain-containing protein n=1 Tax=Salinicola endophyticus TaxID=1949083 RepID=A0ABY8FK68_9GAMM|nr:dihydroxyacetone kinase subunit DhaK [Salinicola endophyticus]WFF43202.1 DAK2 domain-containing protein [Salinicola endophyticus]